jgi:hypothetical protein
MAACQIITETMAVEELPGWRSLFAPRTSAAVFSDPVSDHEVLAPTPGAFLERPQYDALLKALDAVGETAFLWMLLEVDETKVRTEIGWPTRLLCKGPPTWQQFVDERLMPLDSLLWSPEGTWGIVRDHDRYALAGGSEHFIRRSGETSQPGSPTARARGTCSASPTTTCRHRTGSSDSSRPDSHRSSRKAGWAGTATKGGATR